MYFVYINLKKQELTLVFCVIIMWSEKFNWHFDYARLVLDAGFCFNKLKQDYAIDKSKLALLDVDSIVKEKDVSTLERYIPVVVHFKLENEQSQVLDANFVKVFRICQLAIEYLIFCKMYLDNTVVLLKKELSKCMQVSFWNIHFFKSFMQYKKVTIENY